MAKDPRNQRRKENYRRLREAGFSSAEADRIKGSAQEIVEQVIKTKKLPPVNPYKQAQAKGLSRAEMKTSPEELKKWEKSLDAWEGRKKPKTRARVKYIDIQQEEPAGAIKNYYSRYSYVMSYETKDNDGVKQTKYVTITSDSEKTLADLKRIMREDIFPENDSKYGEQVLVSTIKRTSAYYNSKPGTRTPWVKNAG